MADEITLLLTACGTKASPGIVECLRDTDYDFKIIGTDMREANHGTHFVDEFYTVPNGTDPAYPERLLEIAKENDVDVISPLSDEEVVTLSQNKDLFRDQGIPIVCSDPQATKLSNNKGEMLDYLSERSVVTPEYGIPGNEDELDTLVRELGYPDKEVVLKPTTGRGGRGVWILSERVGKEELLYSRDRKRMPYDWIKQQLRSFPEFPDVVVMEYLSGRDYNLDTLVESGDPIYTIPVERIEPDAGPVETGRTVHDQVAVEMAADISEAFEFDYNINIEMAYRDETNTGNPLVYEINPRISGPIAAYAEAGVNMFLYGILMALERNIPRDMSFDEIIMRRCWQEVYEVP